MSEMVPQASASEALKILERYSIEGDNVFIAAIHGDDLRKIHAALSALLRAMSVTSEQYDAICQVIDRAKNDDRSLDTDEYAGMIVDALMPGWTEKTGEVL